MSDYYQVLKVDTCCDLKSSMGATLLLDFIKEKVTSRSSQVVIHNKDQSVTLGQVFDKLGLPLEYLTLDSLDVRAAAEDTRFRLDW